MVVVYSKRRRELTFETVHLLRHVDCVKRDARMWKETQNRLIHVKKDLQKRLWEFFPVATRSIRKWDLPKKPTTETYTRDLQKRPTKETYTQETYKRMQTCCDALNPSLQLQLWCDISQKSALQSFPPPLNFVQVAARWLLRISVSFIATLMWHFSKASCLVFVFSTFLNSQPYSLFCIVVCCSVL